jgi:hypothetical protein
LQLVTAPVRLHKRLPARDQIRAERAEPETVRTRRLDDGRTEIWLGTEDPVLVSTVSLDVTSTAPGPRARRVIERDTRGLAVAVIEE